MIVESIYNHYLFDKDYTLVYNHYTNTIGRVMDTEAFHRMVDNVKAGKDPGESALVTQLIKDGFFVDKDTDERALGELAYQDGIYDTALNVTILASEQCNFRCGYCYEDFKRGNITPEVIDSFYKYMKKNIHKYSKVNVSWFGGEPLLASGEIEYMSGRLIDLCNKNGKPYWADMTTNGYLLTADMMRRMLKCRISNYQITLDGIGETHNKTRSLAGGGPTFDTILSNLRAIRDTVTSRLFTITLRTNLTKSQLPLTDGYIQFIHDEFGKDGRFMCYFRPAGDWGGLRVKNITGELVTTFEELYTPLLQNVAAIHADAYIPLLKAGICQAADRNSFVLGSDGSIYKCTMFFDEEFNKLGKLIADGRMELDRSKFARWVTVKAEPAEKCRSCNVWPLCHNRTCPARLFFANENRTNCGYERKSIDYVLKFLDGAGSKNIKTYKAEEAR
jgi:uncharacterized protein